MNSMSDNGNKNSLGEESLDNEGCVRLPRFIHYLDRQDNNSVFMVDAVTVVSLEKLRESHVIQKKLLPGIDDAGVNFMGVVISTKVVPPKKAVSTFQQTGGEPHRAADRIIIVSDVRNPDGHCAAIIFQKPTDSRNGFDHLLLSHPLVGQRVLLMNVSLKGEDIDCLHNDRDVPILLFDAMYPCQDLRTTWALIKDLPFNPPKDDSVTRAVTFKNYSLRVSNISVVHANCNARFCDRSMSSTTSNDVDVKCICLNPKGFQGGFLVLRMDIHLYRTEESEPNVLKDKRYDMTFHPFQSLQWSKFLLGPTLIEIDNRTTNEWDKGIGNLRKFIRQRVTRINEDGGWDLFAWYKNGLVENKLETPDSNAAKSSNSGGGGFSSAKKAADIKRANGKYGSMAVKPHIVRILPRHNVELWLGENEEPVFEFNNDILGTKRKVPEGESNDVFISQSMF